MFRSEKKKISNLTLEGVLLDAVQVVEPEPVGFEHQVEFILYFADEEFLDDECERDLVLFELLEGLDNRLRQFESPFELLVEKHVLLY